MIQNELTLNEVRARGLAALLRELGPVGYVQFIRQFEVGRGDYTKDRHQWLDPITHEEFLTLLQKAQVNFAVPAHPAT